MLFMNSPTPMPSSGYADGVWGADGKTYCGPRNSRGSTPASFLTAAGVEEEKQHPAGASVSLAMIVCLFASWMVGANQTTDLLCLAGFAVFDQALAVALRHRASIRRMLGATAPSFGQVFNSGSYPVPVFIIFYQQ
jgi:hypothetical protein